MIHPLRTLLYELLVEPVVLLWQQRWYVGSLPVPQTATPDGAGPPSVGPRLRGNPPEAGPEESHEHCNL